ncbi:MAG: aldehyde dehydrogenase family protein, partial [Mycobacterium sp.]
MTAPVQIRHLVAGEWCSGNGDSLLSVNPARPGIVVAEGRSTGTSDVDAAVAAAIDASLSWAGTPIHQR